MGRTLPYATEHDTGRQASNSKLFAQTGQRERVFPDSHTIKFFFVYDLFRFDIH
jgi:hypothetical protein